MRGEVPTVHDLFIKVTPFSHICVGLVQGAVCVCAMQMCPGIVGVPLKKKHSLISTQEVNLLVNTKQDVTLDTWGASFQYKNTFLLSS